MSAEFSTNVGLANTAAKQYAIAKQVQPNNKKVDDESALSKDKGNVYGEKIVDMANPHVDEYVTALQSRMRHPRQRRNTSPP